MSDLILRELTENDEEAFFSGLKEWSEADRSWYTFDWKPGMPFHELLSRLHKNTIGEDLPEGFVPSTMLYAFVDKVIVGRAHLRHRLNDYLRSFGGHYGCSVAQKFRRKGYAAEMFSQSMQVFRQLGIFDILITCEDCNEPSWRLAELKGAVLENKLRAPDGKVFKRYWLKLT